jgi:hypothetical protein
VRLSRQFQKMMIRRTTNAAAPTAMPAIAPALSVDELELAPNAASRSDCVAVRFVAARTLPTSTEPDDGGAVWTGVENRVADDETVEELP